MANSVLFVAGLLLFFGGGLGILSLLFSNGGVAKSQQLRVLGELLSGQRGAGSRRAAVASMLAAAAGGLLAMVGVKAGDAEWARRCEARCAAAGARGTLGPSTAPHPTRKGAAAFVACICEGPDGARRETRADELAR